MGVTVALKVCYVDGHIGAPPTMEAELGKALRHPNIVQLFGSDVVTFQGLSASITGLPSSSPKVRATHPCHLVQH